MVYQRYPASTLDEVLEEDKGRVAFASPPSKALGPGSREF
jgi:hypothetical protein